MKLALKLILKIIIFLILGAVITLLTTYTAINGIELEQISNPHCGISAGGLPISFIDQFRDPTLVRPLNCIQPQPLVVRPHEIRSNLLKIALIFVIDSIFWSLLLFGVFKFFSKILKNYVFKLAIELKVLILVIILIILFFLIVIITVRGQTTINFDLANLRDQNALFTKAYDVIKVQDAWNFVLNSKANTSPVIIGVVDTGVDTTHQEFNNPKVNFGSSPSGALFDSRSAKGGHGTQVTGIIASNNVLDSSLGLSPNSPQMNGILSGILQESQYTLEIENYFSIVGGQSMGVYVALQNALKRNPTVVNMSFGSPKCSAISALRRKLLGLNECYTTDAEFIDAFGEYVKIFNAPENQNTTFVTGAGNWDIDTRLNVLPATIRLINLITVGGTNLEDTRAVFDPLVSARSNFGSDVDLSAPANSKGLYAPKPNNVYDKPGVDSLGAPTGFSGTSASAPMVTGVAAILKSIKPELTPAEIKNILIKSADPIQTGEPNKRIGTGCYANPNNPVNTGCRLNALKAVQALLQPPTPVRIIAIWPPGTTADYLSLFWIKNTDPDFASYKIFRAHHSNVTTNDTLVAILTNQNQVYFKNTGLVPGLYFYKIFTFNQAGSSSPSNEILSPVVSPDAIISRIPGIPEPGDTHFPPNVAVPSFVSPIFFGDCPHDPFDQFFGCLGPFFLAGPRLDGFGHLSKFRRFDVFLNNFQFNNQPNFEFRVHVDDNPHIKITAQDRDYTASILSVFGLRGHIPIGQSILMAFQAWLPGITDIFVETPFQQVKAGILNIMQ